MAGALALCRELLAAIDSGELDRVPELTGGNGFEFRAPGTTLRSPDQLAGFIRSWCEAFPDLRHQVVEAVESGDRVAYEAVVTGTHTGTLASPRGDLPATGRQVRIAVCGMGRVDGSRFVSIHNYFDQVGFLTQLGLVPEPATA